MMNLNKVSQIVDIIDNFDNKNINVAFLFTVGRSGSILAQSLLDGHEQILQLPFIFYYYIIWNDFSNLTSVDDLEILYELVSSRVESEKNSPFFSGIGNNRDEEIYFDKFEFENNLKLILKDLKLINRKNLFLAINFAWALLKNKDISKIKCIFCHHHFFWKLCINHSMLFDDNNSIESIFRSLLLTSFGENIDEMKSDFTNVKYLISIRHPIETFYSYYKTTDYKNKLDISGYISKLHSILHGYATLNYIIKNYSNNYKIIKLEDLHTNSESELRSISDFLGVNFSNSLLQSTIDGKQFWLSSAHPEKNVGLKGLDPVFAKQKWINELDPEARNIALNFLKKPLLDYNYHLPAQFQNVNNTNSFFDIKQINSIIYILYSSIELYPKFDKLYSCFFSIYEVIPYILKYSLSSLYETNDFSFYNEVDFLDKKVRFQQKLFTINLDKSYDSYLVLFIGNNNIPTKDTIKDVNKKVDLLVVPSNYLKEHLIELGIIQSKISVLPFPIDSDIYYKNLNKKHDKLLSLKGMKFLYIGDLNDVETLKIIIESFLSEFNRNEDIYLILKRADEIPVTIDFINELVDNEKTIKSLLNLKEAGDRVIYMSDVNYDFENIFIYEDNIAQIYNSCDFFVYPNLNDFSGINILKALYFDLPVIAIDNELYQEFCKPQNSILIDHNEENGSFVDPNLLKKAFRKAFDERHIFKQQLPFYSDKIRKDHDINIFNYNFKPLMKSYFDLPPINTYFNDLIAQKINLAESLFQNKSFVEAQLLFSELHLYTSDKTFVYKKALCQIEIGNYEEALYNICDYLETNPINDFIKEKIQLCIDKTDIEID